MDLGWISLLISHGSPDGSHDGLPLDRVQVYEYMLVVMRLYSAEMARTSQLLRARFDQARADVATQAAKDIDAAKDPAAKVAAARAATAIAELTANGQLPAEAVKTLLRQLDAPFAPVRPSGLIGD